MTKVCSSKQNRVTSRTKSVFPGPRGGSLEVGRLPGPQRNDRLHKSKKEVHEGHKPPHSPKCFARTALAALETDLFRSSTKAPIELSFEHERGTPGNCLKSHNQTSQQSFTSFSNQRSYSIQKLLGTSASLLVTSALLVVTRSERRNNN